MRAFAQPPRIRTCIQPTHADNRVLIALRKTRVAPTELFPPRQRSHRFTAFAGSAAGGADKRCIFSARNLITRQCKTMRAACAFERYEHEFGSVAIAQRGSG